MCPPKHRKYWTYLLILLLLSIHCYSCLQFFHLLSCLFLLSNVVFRLFRLYIHHISSHVSVLPHFFNGFCWCFCIHPHFQHFSAVSHSPSRIWWINVPSIASSCNPWTSPFWTFPSIASQRPPWCHDGHDAAAKGMALWWGRGDVLGWFDAFFGELKGLNPRNLCYFDGIWPAKIMI